MLKGLVSTLIEIIGSDNIDVMIDTFSQQSYVWPLLLCFAGVLICMTVAFVFKFILKLVDR